MSEVAGLFGGGTDERISQLEAQLAEAAEQLSTTLYQHLRYPRCFGFAS